MRCKACNKQLSDTESWYNETTGEFNSLCNICKPISDRCYIDIEEEGWRPDEPVYPHDLRWEGVAFNQPDSDD